MPTALLLRICLAMLAFAGNSLLCRLALRETAIDPASFTSVRLASGALLLGWLLRRRDPAVPAGGDWPSALALWAYAAGFSYAYVGLTAATGALLLFGAVQLTMIGVGLARGERLVALQSAGLLLALAGLAWLLLPGVAAPPPERAALMVVAGVAWGIYSLRGKGARNPTAVTAGNFRRAALPALLLSLLALLGLAPWSIDPAGFGYALASGALASGAGYALWYAVLPQIGAAQAATLQLSVPVIAAAGGVLLLGEALTLRLVLASVVVLGGVALVLFGKRWSRR